MKVMKALFSLVFAATMTSSSLAFAPINNGVKKGTSAFAPAHLIQKNGPENLFLNSVQASRKVSGTTTTALSAAIAPVAILRDSYIVWAIFYTEATRKMCVEANSDPLIFSSSEFVDRFGMQLVHILVLATTLLWADVPGTHTGNAITNFIGDLFT